MEHLDSPELRARVQKLMQEHHVPGLSVALVLDGNTTSFAFGHASLNPSKPCTAETLFDIASSSKSLTAASVALLVHDEQKHPEIQWDTPMSELLPEDFVTMEESYTKGITVEDILSHRTGIPSHDSSYLGERAKQPDNARSVTRNLRNLPLRHPIRSKFIYNNLMFTIATHLVEERSKKTFTDFLEERIFQPLGMHETSLQLRGAVTKGLEARVAIGHAWDSEKDDYLSFPVLNTAEDQGAGSIITTANDYLKWVKALMNCEGCITKEIQESLTTPRSIADSSVYPLCSPELYTLGLSVSYYRGYKIVSHNGRISGFGSRHFFLPDLNFGGVILGNSGPADDVATILSYELTDEVLKIPKAERTDWNEFETKRLAELKAEYEQANEVDTLREKLSPGLKNSQPQETPLSAYTGKFYNAGYKSFTVQLQNDHLYSDASDRGCGGFDLAFEHVCDQTKYIVHLRNLEDREDELLAAEFVLEDGKAVRLGIRIEPEIDEYIWFDRV